MKKVALEELILRQEGFPEFSRDLLEMHQLKLLNMQLARAKRSSRFYADYPDRLSSLSELSALPFTTADDIRENFPLLCLSPADELARIRTEFTSGTTGKAKRMAYSEYDCQRTVDFFEAGLSELIFPEDKVLVCFPFSDELSLGGLISSAVKLLGATPVLAGVGKTYRELISLIDRFNINVYVGMPVTLLSVLRLYGDNCPLKRALVSGDGCADSVTEYCEAVLGTKLFPHYGLRESGLGCACTCSAHEGMHTRENDIIYEIIDHNGNLICDGEWGELVISSIGLDAMPLFRYKTGDIARKLPLGCPCGSNILRIDVLGRIEKNIAIGYYDNVLFNLANVIDFSIIDSSIIIAANGNLEQVKNTAQKLCRSFDITVKQVSYDDSPMYLGKRHIIYDQQKGN